MSDTLRKPLRLLPVLMGVGLLGWLIARTGASNIVAQVKAIGWRMVLILALGGVSHLVRTWAWRLTFRSAIHNISTARTFALRLISEAIGNFGIAGQVVGDGMRISLLGPSVPVSDRISSVALDRGLYMVSAAAVSAIGMLLSVLLLPLPGIWRRYALIFTGGMAAFLVLALASLWRQWRILSPAARVASRLPWAREWVTKKVSLVESVEENLLGFHSRAPKAFWGATALYVSSQLFAVAEVYLLLRFMGVQISIAGSFVLEAFTKLISVVGALNPGNIGTYEGGNLLLARLIGVTASAGLTLALCRRARTLFWAGIGAVCLVVLSRGKDDVATASDDDRMNVESPEVEPLTSSELSGGDGPAVLILVEPGQEGSESHPALSRVGGLPVLLRAVLTAEMMRPSRIVVALPISAAPAVLEELHNNARWPTSVEWRRSQSGQQLLELLRDVASSSEKGVVLFSGSAIYKPDLVRVAAQGAEDGEAILFRTGTRPAGLCWISRSEALRLSYMIGIDDLDTLLTRLVADCDVSFIAAPEDQWQRIRTAADERSASRRLDSWLVKPTDGIFARMNRRISIPLSHQLIKTPITPNVVTFGILAVSISAGVFYARGGYWNMLLGALLSAWASILDGCDGEVARLKLLSSEFGCWLDTICDYLYYVITFAGITIGLNRSLGTNAYLGWGAALVAGALLSFFVISWHRSRMAAKHPEKFLAQFQREAEKRSSNPLLFLARQTEFVLRRCFFPYALLAAACLNLTKEIFVAAAVVANLTWPICLYVFFVLSNDKLTGQVPAIADLGGDAR